MNPRWARYLATSATFANLAACAADPDDPPIDEVAGDPRLGGETAAAPDEGTPGASEVAADEGVVEAGTPKDSDTPVDAPTPIAADATRAPADATRAPADATRAPADSPPPPADVGDADPCAVAADPTEGSAVGACTVDLTCANGCVKWCDEYAGAIDASQAAALEAQCKTASTAIPDGIWTAGGCDHTTALGGCRAELGRPDGATRTTWHYPSSELGSAQDVEKRCAEQGETFVKP